MKSAHIIRRFTFEEWGGTESVVFNTAIELNALGTVAEILATQALCIEKKSEVSGVKISRFKYNYPYFPMTLQRQNQLDKKGGNPYSFEMFNYLMQHDFDFLHVHTMGRLANMVRRVARLKKIPYVMTFHGGCFDIPQVEKETLLRPLKGTLRYGFFLDYFFGLRHDAVADASGLICVGRQEFDLARERFPQKEIIYLPNGVNDTVFSTPSTVEFYSQYHIDSNRKIMLCVSRIDYQKNQLALLDLLVRLRQIDPSWFLVLIGPVTSEWYYQKIVEKIAFLQLSEHVLLLSGLPPHSPDLVAAYQAATLFVLPSIHEPFGIVLLEAMAASCPVLAAPVGGINGLITDSKNGLFVDFSDVDSVAKRIVYLSSQEGLTLRETIIKQALKDVHEKYTWSAITQQLMRFYERICSKKT